jgi:hypothetical protein
MRAGEKVVLSATGRWFHLPPAARRPGKCAPEPKISFRVGNLEKRKKYGHEVGTGQARAQSSTTTAARPVSPLHLHRLLLFIA